MMERKMEGKDATPLDYLEEQLAKIAEELRGNKNTLH